jgi:DNA-binding NarL/FixJ family response regulator
MRVILADSNEIIRIGLRGLLNNEPAIEIVGEAKSSVELIELANNFESHVVLLDYTSKNFSIDVIPQLIQQNSELKVVAITPDQSAQTLVHALRSGVCGYVKKDCDAQEIIDSVRETYRGNRFFCGQILETIRNANINVEDLDVEGLTCEPISISDRESEIITLIANGLTNSEVAERLFISNHTVNTHRKNIMAKLGVKNTAGIVMYAVKANLVSPNKFLFANDGAV